jgi:hypothetical protein
MKKFTLTFIFSCLPLLLMAQVPAGFSYQAVVRNNSGEVVAGKTVNSGLAFYRTVQPERRFMWKPIESHQRIWAGQPRGWFRH